MLVLALCIVTERVYTRYSYGVCTYQRSGLYI